MIDLWPETITETEIISPVTILREQAKLLGNKTKNLVKAEVGIGDGPNKFVYHFYIIAATLNNYHFRLFSIEHGIGFYPLTVLLGEELGMELDGEIPLEMRKLRQGMSSWDHYTIMVNTEEQFLGILTKILSSKKTKQVISALLAQVSNWN